MEESLVANRHAVFVIVVRKALTFTMRAPPTLQCCHRHSGITGGKKMTEHKSKHVDGNKTAATEAATKTSNAATAKTATV